MTMLVPSMVVGASEQGADGVHRVNRQHFTVIIMPSRTYRRFGRGAPLAWVVLIDGKQIDMGYSGSITGAEWAAYDALSLRFHRPAVRG